MDKDEEWNNFMHKVTEITNIVHGLASEDKEQAAKATILADKYLNEKANVEIDDDVVIRIKCDKTMLNKRDEPEKKTNSNEMDVDSFKQVVERDIKQRAEDKKVRVERAETFKTRAAKAFRRGDYELALSCYDKAIEQIKDSCLLYTNRALTNIKLKNYNKVFDCVIEKLGCLWDKICAGIKMGFKDDLILPVIKEVFNDCKWALRLNENSFKAHLYETKAHQGMKNEREYETNFKLLLTTYPQYKDAIEEFLRREDSDSEDSDEN